jgi:DNA-binding XRE family transcriptional regulator
MKVKNNLQRVREEQMLSKAELARRAGVSVLTIDRIERGERCRHSTKRKILEALGIDIVDRQRVFPDPPPEREEE